MWAAWSNKTEMVEFLLDLKADYNIINHSGDNVLDICIKRMRYKWALIFKKLGLEPKEIEHYIEERAVEFDLELFLDCVNEERELENNSIFLEKMK